MPTYDYECSKCGHRFERFQSFSEKNLRKCPECGKNGLERLIGTGGAILFKGSGFYATDYRSQDYKDRAKADREAESKGGTSSEKPDAKDGGSGSKTPDAKADGTAKGNRAAKGEAKGDRGAKGDKGTKGKDTGGSGTSGNPVKRP
jgi:putative FmdB family regulatory protein